MSITIQIEANSKRSKTFWLVMGPFFANREIAKELGGPLYDDESMGWVLAWEDNKVVGWAGFRIKEDSVGELEWSWVAPGHRRSGIWKALHEARINCLKNNKVSVVRTSVRDPNMVKALEKTGLRKIGSRGAWTRLEGTL